MNKAILLAVLAITGLVALVATGIHLGKQSPTVARATAPTAESAKAAPATEPQIASDSASGPPSSAPPDLANGRFQYDRKRMAEFQVEAARYTQTFQPGVVTDESTPRFVTLFERAVGSSAITTLFQDHKDIQADGWSASMEYRLGRYFEAQPEISMTKASASCRPSRCLLQFMELPQAERQNPGAMAMLLRLRQEPWYSEEFLDGDLLRPLRVPTRGDDVQYIALILNRQSFVP